MSFLSVRRATPKQQHVSLCITTSDFIPLATLHPQQTGLSLITNKQCVFASSSSGMPLFELPVELENHAEGNRETAISFLRGEEAGGSQEHQP